MYVMAMVPLRRVKVDGAFPDACVLCDGFVGLLATSKIFSRILEPNADLHGTVVLLGATQAIQRRRNVNVFMLLCVLELLALPAL